MYRLLLSSVAAALLTTGASQAATVSFDLWLYDAFDNSLITTDGLIGYDTDDVSAAGSTTLTPSDGITLSFTADGIAYDETNDVDYSSFPAFEFFNGDLTFIDYVLVDGVNGVDFTGAGYDFQTASFADDLTFVPPNGPSAAGYYTVSVLTDDLPAVPLPAGAPLVASAFGAFAFLRRKKKKAA